MDVQRREDRLLDKIQDLIGERDQLKLEVEALRADLMVAVEAALVRHG